MRYRSGCRQALITIAALLAIGCKRTATIEGDLSLVTQSGEIRKGPLQPVYLLRGGDSISLAVDKVCEGVKAGESQRAKRIKDMDAKAERFKRASERASMNAGVALFDSAMKYRRAAEAERQSQDGAVSSLDRIRDMVRAAADTQVETDMDAHYRIENLAPGKYVVYAEWSSDQDLPFWAAVDVRAGEKKKQDLDKATLAMGKIRCQ